MALIASHPVNPVHPVLSQRRIVSEPDAVQAEVEALKEEQRQSRVYPLSCLLPLTSARRL
jgi:hypothetical protein